MAANNDFFVKFGSNATTWARELDRQLKPARDQVLAMEAMLNRLERKGDGVSTKLQRAFASDLDRRGSGGGTSAGSAPMPTGMSTDLQKAASQIYALTDSLEATVRALKGLPDLVKRTMREANGVVNQSVGANDQYRVAPVGSIAQRAGTYGTSGTGIPAPLYSVLSKLGTNPTPAVAPASISGVGSSAVIEAGLRRVQESIEAQTKQLTAALGNITVETTPSAGGGGGSTAGADAPARASRTKAVAAEVGDAADSMVAGMRDQLEGARTVYAQMEGLAKSRLADLRDEHGEESKIYQDRKKKVEANLQEQRATIAKMESSLGRATAPSALPEGASRTDRSAERKAMAAAAREEYKKLPMISEQEITRRQREMDLIRSTVDPKFLEQVGRGKGDYGKSDLSEMGRALKEQGFDPQLRTRDTMDAMALKIQEAGDRFARTFQDTIPDSLRTTGFQKYRETEIPQNLQRILAQANDEVIQAYSREREESRRILSQTYQGGDTGDLSRGRRTYGTGLAKSEMGPVPLGQFTPSMVRAAEDAFKANSERQRESALGLMRQGNFDPYDPALTRGIKQGNTPEERTKAADALNVVRDLREATTEIDRTGQAYVSAGRKIQAMERIIEYINRQLLADANRPEGEKGLSRTQTKFLEDRLDTYSQGIRSQMQTRSQSRSGYGDLFDTPEYRQGLDARRRSRQDYEARRESFRTGDRQNDFFSLRNGLGDALRQAMGSDFRFNETKGRIGNANGLSRDDSKELNQAFQHYISVLRQAADAARQGEPGRNDLPSRFENATVGLLNKLEKSFNGLAPRFEDLASLGLDKSGYPIDSTQDYDIRRIQNEENLAGEARREAARQAADAAKKNRTTQDYSDEERLMRSQEDLVRANENLRKARERAAAATAAVAEKEAEAQTRMSGLNEQQRQKAIAAADRAADLRTQISRIGEDKKNGGNLVYIEDPAARAGNLDDRNHYPGERLRAAPSELYRELFDIQEKLSENQLKAPYTQSGMEARRSELRGQIDQYPDLEAERRRLRDELARAEIEAKPYKGVREAMEAERVAEAEMKGFAAEVEKAATRVKKASDKLDKPVAVEDGATAVAAANEKTKTARKVAAAADAEAAALRSERAALRKQGPYTRGDVKGLRTAADEAESAVSGRRLGAQKAAITRAENRGERVATINAMRETLAARQKEAVEARKAANEAQKRADKIRAINRKLDALDGGSGAGGGKPPVARGGSSPTGPGDDGVLRQILNAINAMHNTLKKGGIRVTGAVTGKTEPAGTSAPTPKTAPRTSLTDEQKKARDATLNEQRRLEVEGRALRNEQKAETVERQRTSARNKASAAIREQEQAAQSLAAAMGRLSASTRAEISELERLNRIDTTGMDKAAREAQQRAVAQSQIRVYSGVDQDLAQERISGTDRRNAAGAVLNQFGPQTSGNELAGIARAARAQNPSRIMDRQLGQGVPDPESSDWMQSWGNLFGNKGFWGRIVGSTGAFIVRNFAAGAVFGLTNALQQTLDQALQTEMTFVRVSQALEATGKPIGDMRQDLQNISTDYGVALNDVYTSAASLQGLFENTEEIAAATRVSTQLQVISGGALNAAEAVGVLASTYTAFQNQPELQGADGLQKIADTFTLLQNELGVNIEITAEGVSSLAGAAESMGISFQETAVYAGQIAKLTNQSGAAAGEQLSRILASTLTGRGKNALQESFDGLIDDKTGRDLGQAMSQALAAGDQGDVLTNLMMGWDQLSDTQQDNLAVTIAGQRQMRAFQGLMQDTEGTLSLITKAYRANGDAEERMAALMQTLNKQIDVLMQNFTNFALALIESGVLNFFGSLLIGVNAVLKTINDLLAGFNQFAEATPFVKFLRDTITWAAGAAITFKLLGASISGLRGALRMNNAEQGLLSSVTGAPNRDRQGSVPIGPGLRGSLEHRDSLNDPVNRPGWRSFGPAGPQIGVARTAGFAMDRIIRVPMERTGRILEKGGLKWEQSNNTYVRKLGQGADFLSRQFNDAGRLVEMGVRTSIPRESTRTSALQRFGESRQARADALSGRYADQRALAMQTRLGGDPARQQMLGQWRAGGMSLYDEARRSAVDPSLAKQARVQQALANAANGTSTALTKTSNTFKSIASSGLAADAALVGVGLAIAAVLSYRSQIKELRDVAEDAASAYEAPKPLEENDATDWMGVASTNLTEASKKFAKDGAGFTAGLGSILSSSPKDFGRMLTGLGRDGDTVSELVARDTVGIDYSRGADTDYTDIEKQFADRLEAAGSPLADQLDIQGREFVLTGMTEAADMYSDYMGRLGKAASGQMGYIPDALASTGEDFRTDLEKATAEIQNDKTLTEGQKVASLAYIEMLDGLITAEIADRTAVSSGLATGGLNTDQLTALQQAIASINGERRSQGGIDMSPIIGEQIDAAGLEKGDEIATRLAALQKAGISTADAAVQEYNILQDAAKAAQANWLTELRKDPASDAFQAADSQLNSLLSELDRVGSSAVEEIVNEAEGLAAAAEAAGQYAKAARIRLAAMRDVNKFNRQKNDPGPIAGIGDAAADAPRGFSRGADPQEDSRGKKRRATKDPALVAGFSAVVQNAIFLATKDITLQIARTSDAAVRAGLVALKAQIEGSILAAVSSGAGISSIDTLPPRGQAAIDAIPQPVVDVIDKGSRDYGSAAVSQEQVFESQVATAEAQTGYADAQAAAAEQAQGSGEDAAATARANKAALQQARLGVASAAAEARGDAVAAAKIQVAMAKAQLSAARAELGAAKTASDAAAARVSVLNAQAALIGAQAGVQAAQQDLVQSQYQVSIALAEAAGNTVEAARRQLGAARQALAAARRKSGGEATAEVNAARVSLIQAQAAARDAALQDQLDTIDFNLEMGKTTQSAAISALQEILRTSDLTKQQRRQLLLQIKGMKDEMADSQWNFGDIKLPTPYQMRRYINERRDQFSNELEAAATGGRGGKKAPRRDQLMGLGAPEGNEVRYGNGGGNTTTIYINGADIGKVKKVIKDVVGGSSSINTRTTGARRNR